MKNRIYKFRVWDKEEKKMEEFEFGDLYWRGESTGNYDFPTGYIVMQFTGLKDKNGKEIYEGDILQHDSDQIFEIKDMRLIWNEKEVEVLGNVYENPELLKED